MNVVSTPTSPYQREAEDGGAGPLEQLYATLLRRWRIISAAAILVFVGVLATALLSPKIYTATALVMVSPAREQVIAQEQMIDSSAPNSAAVDSEIEVLRSPMLAARLVTALNLDQDPEWNSHLRSGGALSAALTPQRVEVAGAPGAEADRQANVNRVAQAVSRALTVRRRGASYGIQVSMDSRNPRRAAELANKMVELYLVSQTEARFETSQRANSWLSGRLTELREDVRRKETAAEAFRLAHGLSSAAGGAANQQPQSSEVQALLVQTRADLAEKEARLRQVQRLIASGGSADSIANTLNSPVIAELRSREATIAQNVAELRQRYSAEHPAVLAAESELENAHLRIQEEISRITANLRNEVEVSRARLGTLQGSFGSVTGTREENNEAVIEYRELLRDAGAARSVQESFLQRFEELANQGELPVSTSRLVSPATRPSEPSKPKLQSALLLAVLLAGLSGVGLALLVEALDTSLGNAEDAERKLGVRSLSSIPALNSQNFKGVAPSRHAPFDYLIDKPASAFAEALRVLRTSLVHTLIDRKRKVLAVTSAVPDEGKTTLSLCLGRMSALAGQKVVLVDCDLRRHSLSESIGAKAELGLLEVLAGEGLWRQALVQDAESGVQVLPIVAPRFTSQEVFSSDAMSRLLEELREAFDLVILDAAPVLAIAESRTVAGHADATLIVVRSDKTPAVAVKTAIQEIERAGGTVAGVALNFVDARGTGPLYFNYAHRYYQN